MTEGMAFARGWEILILRLSKYLLDAHYSLTLRKTVGLAVSGLSSKRFKLVKRQSKLKRMLLNLSFLASKMKVTASTRCDV